LNALRPNRPMVTIDQIPWHEMDVEDELALQCEDPQLREIEQRLRRTIYSWKRMPADMVVRPVFTVTKVVEGVSFFGITIAEETAVRDPANNIISHRFFDQLQTDEDLEKIRTPEIVADAAATAAAVAGAADLFDGILDIEEGGHVPSFSPWDHIVTWRSPDGILFDMMDRPDFLHRIIARVTQAYHSMLDQLEAQGLLSRPQDIIHCTGAFSDQLPAPGYDPQRPRPADIWTCGMAQIFSTVSPEAHKEFDIDYAVGWYESFGHGYYGCCEPLYNKIEQIRALPNLKKISMSPWVDTEQGAERIGGDYVFSRKPSPAFLAVDEWDAGAVEKDLRETVDCCARHGTPVELILKDISTVRYQPQRLWEWAEIARRIANE
jgi:hypothetical protein